MTRIAGLLFDKDGTLFDFHASWGNWAATLMRDLAGGDEARAEVLGRAVGYDMTERAFLPDSPAIAGTPEVIGAALLAWLPGASPAGLLARMNALAANVTMVPATPLPPLVAQLRGRGLRLGLASNDSEAAARGHLAAEGIAGAFDFIAGHDSGHGEKPGPGMALAYAEACGLDPRQVVMIGDSLHDMLAGRAAGMRTVAVLTGLATRDELTPLADAVLPDIGHLPAWLDAMERGPRDECDLAARSGLAPLSLAPSGLTPTERIPPVLTVVRHGTRPRPVTQTVLPG